MNYYCSSGSDMMTFSVYQCRSIADDDPNENRDEATNETEKRRRRKRYATFGSDQFGSWQISNVNWKLNDTCSYLLIFHIIQFGTPFYHHISPFAISPSIPPHPKHTHIQMFSITKRLVGFSFSHIYWLNYEFLPFCQFNTTFLFWYFPLSTEHLDVFVCHLMFSIKWQPNKCWPSNRPFFG